MKTKMKNIMITAAKTILKVSVLTGVIFALTSGAAFAGDASAVTLKTLSQNVDKSVSSLAVVLSDVALIAGIGFIMAAFFKFHQHKLNPTQVPISQGITLLLIGAGLALFPTMLPTTTTAIFGTGHDIAKVGGAQITGLIGS